jgi:O-antigen/teichoic acid export membrane protein
MTAVKRDLVANFAGNIGIALLSLIFVPVYVRFMGVEVYGLIAATISLRSVLGLLDLGFSTTVTRELARMPDKPSERTGVQDLVRTLEVIYWGIAVLLGATLISLAPLLVSKWLKPSHLPHAAVLHAMVIIGIQAIAEWPMSFYTGGLRGLQRQTTLNAIILSLATVRAVGGVAILLFVSRTVEAFLLWQVAVSASETFCLATALWRNLPEREYKARFDLSLTRRVSQFAAGLSGIALASVLLNQTDKLLLSRMLGLEAFGYYAIASFAAAGLHRGIGPVHAAIFPHFTKLLALRSSGALILAYERSSQFMALVVFPVSVVAAVFAKELLFAWTGNRNIAGSASTFLRILVIGQAINGLNAVPYMMQLAFGATKATLHCKAVLAIAIGPLMYVLVKRWGAAGAAAAWSFWNIVILIAVSSYATKRLLPDLRIARWYWESLVVPAGVPLLICALIHSQVTLPGNRVGSAFVIAGTAALCFIATILACGNLRTDMSSIVGAFRGSARASLAKHSMATE